MNTLRILTAAAVLSASLAVPAFAQPQYVDPYSADVGCQQASNDRGIEGGVIGALTGAVAGNALSSKHHRGAGGVLGAIVGGVAGNAIGSSSQVCATRSYAQTGYAQPAYVQREVVITEPVAAPPPRCGWGERSDRAPDGTLTRQSEWMCRAADGAWHPA